MAKPPPPEIDKPKIKKMLRKAKPSKPMNCGVGIGNDGTAVILLDKIKKKTALLKEMEKEYGDVASGRFGEAWVDKEVDRKLVIISLNRALSGIARKLKKTLKGTGFAKVQIMVDNKVAEEVMEVDPDDEMEDDNDYDDGDEDEDEDTGPGQIRGPEVLEDEPATVSSSEPPAASTQPAPETQSREAPAEPGIDFKALTDQLSKAVRKMIAFADDADRFRQLRAMAEQAQAAIKATQDEAVELVYELEVALEDGASAPPADSAAAPPAAPPPPQSATPETASAATTEGVDFKDLTAHLTSLVKRLVPIRAANPETFATIMALVAKAQGAIKATQDEAVEAVYEVDAAVTAAEAGGAPNAATPDTSGTAPAAPPAPPADPAKEAALGASPKLWTDTMASVAGGINQLKDAIRRDLGSEAPEVLADVERNLGKIDAVTSRFDRVLADLLQGAAAATDAASRQAQLKQARTVLADHIKYASTEPLIGLIDQNPFGVSTNIKNTLVSNLTQLAAVVR